MTAYLTFPSESGMENVPCGVVTTIGRDRSNAIVLPDLQVSRNHAMVRRLGNADYYLIDSGSANGSKVNTRRITSPTLLHDGDRITIGTTEFRFAQETRSPTLNDSVSLQETVIAHTPLIKEITILVADIRGFTTVSEQLPIQTLTRLMNAWFEHVSDIIERNCGTLDKFIGDCVFARWDGDNPCANIANALRTACQVRSITARLSTTFPEIIEPLRIGAGINTGMASLGIGSDNTALGDAVNTAFRLETATKELGTDIVLSKSSYVCLPEHLWRGTEQMLKLKGKHQAVHVVGLSFEQAEAFFSNGQ
jgi:adenylate cyclase